jgi:ribosomal protein L32
VAASTFLSLAQLDPRTNAILEVGVTDYLYRAFPDKPEGQLAKLRSAVVSTTVFERIRAVRQRKIEELGITPDSQLLEKGEKRPILDVGANPACGEKHLPHTACPSCGGYGPRGDRRQVVEA